MGLSSRGYNAMSQNMEKALGTGQSRAIRLFQTRMDSSLLWRKGWRAKTALAADVTGYAGPRPP